MAKRRLFIGSMVRVQNLPEVREKIEELQIEGKWVEPENLHFTYRFLGEIEEERIPQIKLALSGSLRKAKPHKVELKGLGVFKRNGVPSILWVGVVSDEVIEIKKLIDKSLKVFGFAPEEKFTPHVTLLRIKRFRHRAKFNSYLLKMRDFSFGSKTEKSIYLVESKLTSKGPKYTVLEEFSLG